MSEIDLDELERLEKAATPGPWFAGTEDPDDVVIWHGPNRDWFTNIADPKKGCVAFDFAGDEKANAELIAALRNAAPALIARVRELEAEVEGRKQVQERAANWLKQRGLRIAKLEAALREIVDRAEWMTGSSDFAPGGRAHEGFARLRVADVIANARAALEGAE